MRQFIRTLATIGALVGALLVTGSRADETAAHQVTGVILSVDGLRLTLETRTGDRVLVDASAAVAGERATLLRRGIVVTAQGDRQTTRDELVASVITRAKPAVELWAQDR